MNPLKKLLLITPLYASAVTGVGWLFHHYGVNSMLMLSWGYLTGAIWSIFCKYVIDRGGEET